jgi:futalosine hydrolase
MGKTNAARALTALLERRSVAGVVGFGAAGAYPKSGLAVGDIGIAESEHYGDEGVETPTGWISCEGIGIPLLETPTARIFNDFPVDSVALNSVRDAAARTGRKFRAGPFVTVSACSGTVRRAEALSARYGAVCETMEGAAYAHIAAFYRTPFAEIRGISNLVEDRDTSKWRLVEAAEAAAVVLVPAISAWPHPSPSRPAGS